MTYGRTVGGAIENGMVAEWFKAPVLKTDAGFASAGGSNPSRSAWCLDGSWWAAVS